MQKKGLTPLLSLLQTSSSTLLLPVPPPPEIPQICRFPQEVGPCRALLRKYSFNMTTMQCEPFHYGGCLGNSNRFQDLASCNEYCSPQRSQSPPPHPPSTAACFLFFAASEVLECVFLCLSSRSSARSLPGASGQGEVLGLHSSLLLQRGHQEVRGVQLLGLRRQQQQFCVEAELHGCVCQRCVRRGGTNGRNRSTVFILALKKVNIYKYKMTA